MKRKPNRGFWVGAVLALGLVAGFMYAESRPMPSGKAFYVRFGKPTSMGDALDEMARYGVVRNSTVAKLHAWFARRRRVLPGSYSVRPGMGLSAVERALATPIHLLIPILPGKWTSRTGEALQRRQITTKEDYVAAAANPEAFRSTVNFPIAGDTLEGYLWPDTYDLEPLQDASQVVSRQLEAFQKKVWEPLGKPKNLRRVLVVASLIEMETKLDTERPLVAAVIENRLKKKMALQIDATVLYALGSWGKLTHDQIKDTDSPYNTYLHKGLPPGPICSPGLASIEAALHPAKVDYLYYLAMPDGSQRFASDYRTHLKNIRARHEALQP